MTVINSNIPEKSKEEGKNKYNFKNNGLGARSNVKWAYNFKPLLSKIVILFILAATAAFLIEAKNYFVEKKQDQEIYENKDRYRKEFLERKLEALKKETIRKENTKQYAK